MALGRGSGCLGTGVMDLAVAIRQASGVLHPWTPSPTFSLGNCPLPFWLSGSERRVGPWSALGTGFGGLGGPTLGGALSRWMEVGTAVSGI